MIIFLPVMLLYFLLLTRQSYTNTKLTEVRYIKMKNGQGKVLISQFPEFNLVCFGINILNYSFVTVIPTVLSLMKHQPSQKTVQGVSHALS